MVVSEAGGLPEIVADGETGSVVPCGDVAALAAALARMLRDPAWRERAGAAGAERTARLFTHTRMAAGMEALFLRLLDAAAPQEMRES
jgi:glycosyltransferase involved in cell wall biosynthesis